MQEPQLQGIMRHVDLRGVLLAWFAGRSPKETSLHVKLLEASMILHCDPP